jgi:DHA2 family multidrug resistance protein
MVIALAIGNAFTFLSALVLIIANARPPEVVGMIAYVQIFRLLGPALGGAVITTLLRKREAIHSVLLMPYIDRARAVALHLGDSRHGAALAALVRREANVLAFRDVYEFCCVVALLSLVLVACIGPTPSNPLTPGTAK